MIVDNEDETDIPSLNIVFHLRKVSKYIEASIRPQKFLNELEFRYTFPGVSRGPSLWGMRTDSHAPITSRVPLRTGLESGILWYGIVGPSAACG